MINRLRTALAIALVAVAAQAAALGLGQIQVKSRVDQPLLPEIPIMEGRHWLGYAVVATLAVVTTAAAIFILG